MTFISRAARYVLRKRVRTAVLFIVLTIITASMLSATAVSQAAQHEAGQIEKQAVGGFVLASNLQGSMLTPRGGGMVRPADVQRISKLSGVGSCMVRQNATADLVGASVVKVPGGDDYDAEKEQQFGNAANVMGTNDSSKLNVFTSHTLGMVEGRHLKASDKHMSMVHEDLAKTNGLKVGDTLTLKANPYDADNETRSTATVKTTIVGIFKGDSDRKVASRAELHLQHCVHRFGHHKYSVPVQARRGNIPGCHFRSGQGCRRGENHGSGEEASGGLEQLPDHAQ